MPVTQLFVGNDNDLTVSPFTDASEGRRLDDADLRATVCEADVTGLITAATDATPIVITCANHGLQTGDWVATVAVGGNTAARGTFQVTVSDADTFSLNGSAGNGTYTRGGRWYKALPDPLARAIELPWDGNVYLGVLSGVVGLLEATKYAVVFYDVGDYQDKFSKVDIAVAQLRSGNI